MRSRYPRPLVWIGVWKTPRGLTLDGFHVWNRSGQWCGVYKTHSRAVSEAKFL